MSQSFVVLLTQAGKGCDYTIGCGQTWRQFGATDVDEAWRYVRECVQNEFTGDSALKAAVLVPVDGAVQELPVHEWYREFAAALDREKTAANEQRERDEFERLKKKFS